MDKTFIMKLGETTDLLDSEGLIGDRAKHPIDFSTYKTILVKKGEERTTLNTLLENYKTRNLNVVSDNYGLEVSVNYKDGEFVSMLLKGDGIVGESIRVSIATMVMPKTAKNKGVITTHALLTVEDTQAFRFGLTKYDIEKFIKCRLLEGFAPYESKKIVCRPLKLFVDGKRQDIYDTWNIIDNLTIPGLSMLYDYTAAIEQANRILTREDHYLLPQKGVIIEDDAPDTEGAFPETHFIFEQEDIIND